MPQTELGGEVYFIIQNLFLMSQNVGKYILSFKFCFLKSETPREVYFIIQMLHLMLAFK